MTIYLGSSKSISKSGEKNCSCVFDKRSPKSILRGIIVIINFQFNDINDNNFDKGHNFVCFF